jgi:hypothetical protein
MRKIGVETRWFLRWADGDLGDRLPLVGERYSYLLFLVCVL